MLVASEIKNINFSVSKRGFNVDEVNAFLDQIESDYHQYEGIIKGLKDEKAQLEQQIVEFKNAQDSIKNVLLNAQKLADQIVKEAREKSEEIVLKAEANINVITSKEKELASAFELKANERKAALKLELDEMLAKAELKAKSINDAAADAVERQQVLFDKLKLEIGSFKASISAKYKEHLNILQSIPDTVEMEPQKLAELISAKIDAMPDIDTFITVPNLPETIDLENENENENENIIQSSGFVVEEAIEE